MKGTWIGWAVVPMMIALVVHAQSDRTDKSPHESRFATVNGVRLHYLDWGGKGGTMLFLYGIGDTAHSFDGFAPKFTNQFRVLGLTRRGHGQSEVTDRGYDTATRVEDIRQFLDALEISRVVLVAFSASGGEATMFAGRHPERTIKVIYLDALFDADGQPALYRRAPPELRRTQGTALDSRRRRVLELMAAGEVHTDYIKIKAPVLAIAVVGFPANTFEVLRSLPEQRRKVTEEALREVSAVKRRETERFRQELPSARLVMLTNANHACFIDREEDVLREMRQFLSDTGSPPPKMSFPPFVDLQVPLPPAPVRANGKQCLVYELHITNFFTNKLHLTRVEVFGDRSKEPLATYREEELVSQIAHVGFVDRAVAALVGLTVPPDQPDERTIGPGLRAVMFLLLTVDKETDIPGVLRHRLFFKPTVMSASENDDVIEGAPITVVRKRPLVLGPPVRGGGWVAAGALSNTNYHRRSLFPLDGRGRARIPERFAIDWGKRGPNGNAYRDGYANTNAYGYGEEVLAVANAVVADAKDGIPENDPASKENAVPLSLETAAGNYVFLDLRNGYFAHYAHLQPNSLRVRRGQKVRRGQVLGRLGNSGHSQGPHLHFHVVDGNSPFGAEGVPYVFESFEVQGVLPSLSDTWKPPPNAKTDRRRMEIPTENAVIRFP